MKKFWDIESYNNLFCCGILGEDDFLEMFYLVNNEKDKQDVKRACDDSGYKYKLYDLSKDGIARLKWHFEKRIPRTKANSILSDFLGEKDKEVKPKEHWYFGYNILGYDIPMIDFIINSQIGNILQTTTESIREHSDEIITHKKYFNTKPYEMYANQVDCAFLNEKQIEKGRPKIGLKTLVGIKGGSIIESESNTKGHSDNIYEDILYNINDIVELRDVTYPGVMEQTFKIRKNLLNTYPSLKEHGITVNSTSAKFVEYIVAPNEPIKDDPVVSYMYPAKHIADKLGVKQTDVLEDTKDWFIKNVYQQIVKHNKKKADAYLAKFMSIYSYYDAFRGKNWNESSLHKMMYNIPAHTKAERRELMRTYGTMLPFLDKYGNDTFTQVNFSSGGIHGSEIFKDQLLADRKKIKELKEKYGKISMIPRGSVPAALLNLIKIQSRESYNGFPVSLSHEIPHFYFNTKQVDEILDPEDFTPFMYSDSKTKKKEMLLDRYKYTSIGEAIHQDFEGYYPMLMINLGVFYDGNGNDPYDDQYQFRLRVKHTLKTLTFGTKKYEDTDIEQQGYKLVLNSASGILDGSFDTNLRANNKAIAMRSIGQMFTFRIGMLLALEGATVPSTNTDGLYVFNMDLDKNKQLVDEELKKLYIKIEPEPLFLVSKDSNNRMEMEGTKITSARGGTLTSWSGARVDNNLSHPALVDKVMTLYLRNAKTLDGEVNEAAVKDALHEYLENPTILDDFKDYDDALKRTLVYMSSWVMRSTSGSIMIDNKDNIYPGTVRAWLTNEGVHLYKYGTRKSKPSKTLDGYASQLFNDSKLGNPEVLNYLSQVGALNKYFDRAVSVKEYNENRKVINGKVTGDSVYTVIDAKISHLPPESTVYINNHSILKMTPQEIDEIYNKIDFDGYIDMLVEFADTWHNKLAKV